MENGHTKQTQVVRRYLVDAVRSGRANIVGDAAEHFGISRQAIHRHLSHLVREGFLEAMRESELPPLSLSCFSSVKALSQFAATDLVEMGIDWVWVGIRPSLHYVYDEDSDYEVTWFHPEVVVNVNFLHDPVRLYFLAAGGYSGALDTDQYGSIAHGWGVLAGVGVAWQGPCGAGLFGELGFRVGSASRDQAVLSRDENNQPICADTDCLVWEPEVVSRG